MEHCPIRLLRAIHSARDPLEHASQTIQATIVLLRHPDRLLGHRHDMYGRRQELCWTVDHTHPPRRVRVRSYLSCIAEV
jgi:hypothetical protein